MCRNKLQPEDRTKIVELMSKGYGAERIAQYFEFEKGVKLHTPTVHRNYINNPKYQEDAKRLRVAVELKVAEHIAAQKSYRLDSLVEALNEALSYKTDKVYFNKNGKIRLKVLKKSIGAVAAIIEQMRREVEGEEDTGTTTFEEVLIELIRKADKELADVKSIRVVRRKTDKLNKFLARGSSSLL